MNLFFKHVYWEYNTHEGLFEVPSKDRAKKGRSGRFKIVHEAGLYAQVYKDDHILF